MAKIAVIQTGGKQYVVESGAVIVVEKLPVAKGGAITFDKVMLVDDGTTATIGAPFVSGASVSGEIIDEGKAHKVTVIKYRQKSRYFKKRGHRQPFTKVKIVSVS